RRLSRKQVQDIMSSADIQVTGFNLISQHAVTRLAEISTEERSKILESLIGIGTFETKKAEARVQLQEADLNLKVAAARVDEVRQRIEQLERERNDLLRSNLLKTEINSQQARILSAQILALKNRHQEMSQTLEQEQIKSLPQHKKVLDDKLEDSTSKVEKISQKITSTRSSLDLDTKKLREVQDEIDGLGRELTNLTAQSKGSSTKLDLTASHLQTLEARQKEFVQLSEELKTRIREMEKLQKEEEKRLESIEQKTKEYGELKDQRRKEIDEALDIAKKARVTVVEFNTQKNLADNM